MADTKNRAKVDGPDYRSKPENAPLYPASSESVADPATFDSAHPEYFHRPSSEHEFQDMVERGEINADGTTPANQPSVAAAQEAHLEAREEAIEQRPERITDEQKAEAKQLRKDIDKAKDEDKG